MSKKFSITIIEAPDQNQRENPNNQFSNSEPMTFAQKVDYVKNIDMTNNKQQTAVEWLWEIAYNRELTVEDWKQAKEKYEHEMCEFAAEYAQYELQQNKPGIKGAMVSMCAWTFFKNRKK